MSCRKTDTDIKVMPLHVLQQTWNPALIHWELVNLMNAG